MRRIYLTLLFFLFSQKLYAIEYPNTILIFPSAYTVLGRDNKVSPHFTEPNGVHLIRNPTEIRKIVDQQNAHEEKLKKEYDIGIRHDGPRSCGYGWYITYWSSPLQNLKEIGIPCEGDDTYVDPWGYFEKIRKTPSYYWYRGKISRSKPIEEAVKTIAEEDFTTFYFEKVGQDRPYIVMKYWRSTPLPAAEKKEFRKFGKKGFAVEIDLIKSKIQEAYPKSEITVGAPKYSSVYQTDYKIYFSQAIPINIYESLSDIVSKVEKFPQSDNARDYAASYSGSLMEYSPDELRKKGYDLSFTKSEETEETHDISIISPKKLSKLEIATLQKKYPFLQSLQGYRIP